VCRGIGERIDDLQLLDDRAGPSVRDDERQRILMSGTNVNEVNGQPIDLGHEVRQGVQFLLAPVPVVVRRPVVGELLDHRERHTLRMICDGLLVGPARRRDPAAQAGKFLFRDVDVERPDLGGGFDDAAHDHLLCRVFINAVT
jgi:hypothetical protein